MGKDVVPAWLRERLGVDEALLRAIKRTRSREAKVLAEISGFSTRTVQRRLRALALTESSPGVKSDKGGEHLHEPYRVAA